MEEGEIRIHGAVELDRIDPALGVYQVHGHRRETGGLDVNNIKVAVGGDDLGGYSAPSRNTSGRLRCTPLVVA
jgi:hypothetical protein